ncbi:MAG: SDR family oxidoreductase [Lachnospiraceae bacterium]|nr:SDR family oxidoreductase [Lachnospiraceae bacterium]
MIDFSKSKYLKGFDIQGKVCLITGAAGLLGLKHAEAVLEGGGIPVLMDISGQGLGIAKEKLQQEYGSESVIMTGQVDITDKDALLFFREQVLHRHGHIDVLINNAANNPKVEGGSKNLGATRFQDFPLELWNQDIAVGLTGAMLCAQVFGDAMEKAGKGVILNISSDYGLIAPDQRVYRREGVPEEEQIIKPVSYSVVKHAIIGLTKYLAIYWAKKGIRVNTLCPASLENGQDPEFVGKLSELIPLGRMSRPEEYVCTILYLISDACTYMTGATLVVDGGRTSW